MPIYEYKCTACGHVTSVLKKSFTAKKPDCEACGADKTEKVFSTFAAHSGSTRPDNCQSCQGNECSTGMCQGGGCPYSG